MFDQTGGAVSSSFHLPMQSAADLVPFKQALQVGSTISDATFSYNGERVAFATANSQIVIWEFRNGVWRLCYVGELLREDFLV